MPIRLFQRHFANLRHIRDVFRIDPRAQEGKTQIAPWLAGHVQLVYPAFPGAFQFNAPEIRSFADPAAAANITLTVPPNEIWALVAFHARLVTDGNAGNREINLDFDDTANIFLTIPPAGTLGPNSDAVYSWARQIGYTQNPVRKISGLPNMFLQTGWRVATQVSNFGVGDQLSEIVIMVEVFPV